MCIPCQILISPSTILLPSSPFPHFWDQSDFLLSEFYVVPHWDVSPVPVLQPWVRSQPGFSALTFQYYCCYFISFYCFSDCFTLFWALLFSLFNLLCIPDGLKLLILLPQLPKFLDLGATGHCAYLLFQFFVAFVSLVKLCFFICFSHAQNPLLEVCRWLVGWRPGSHCVARM